MAYLRLERENEGYMHPSARGKQYPADDYIVRDTHGDRIGNR